MERYRRLILLSVPTLAIAGLIAGALSVRSGDPTEPAPRKPSSPALMSGPSNSAYVPTARRQARDGAGRAADRVHAHTAYQNYRTAIASGNPALEEAMKSALGSQRDALLALAEEEARSATDETNRQIARKTLESLRR